jgi:hypothetical protein
MLLVCICSYLKSDMIYKFLNLDTYQPDNPYIHVNKDVRIRVIFSKPKGIREQKPLENAV